LQLVDVTAHPCGLLRSDLAFGDLHRQADAEQFLDGFILDVPVGSPVVCGLGLPLVPQPAHLDAVQGGRR